MNKKVIIIGVVILILAGVVLYFASQKTTPTTNQSVNQNIVPTQKLSTGSDVKIVGTVVENITEYASVDGPAYLNVRTDDGAQIRVTYSPGEAECRNMGMASTGFSVKAGARVEVYAKAISEKELFTCDSTAYYIKTLTTSDPKTVNSNIVLSALQRLNIEVTGQPKQVELELPSNLSDANWGMKKTVCEEGGYNLSAYAGKTLLFTSYPINEVWNNTEPLNVWVAN